MRSIGCFLLLFLFLSAPAFAQDVTLFAGFQHPGRITLSSGTGAAQQILTNPADVGVFGIRYGTSKPIGSEHSFAFAPNFLGDDSKSIIYNSNLILQVPTPKIKPYATAGFGTVISWGQGPFDFGTKFALNYGGGLKFSAGGKVGARLDVRGYTIPAVQSQTLNVVEVSLGVLFGF